MSRMHSYDQRNQESQAMTWKYENGAWVSGLYVIKKKFRYFKLFFNGRFVDNFQSLQAAKDAV